MMLPKTAKKRDGYECQKCGREGNSSSLHAHHIHPKWAGGDDELDNLVTLCVHCHRFAPEIEREEVAIEKTEEYLSTDVRPEVDLFLFGMEYGSRVYSEEQPVEAEEVGERLSELFTKLEDGESPRVPKHPSSVYNILFSSWKGSRYADGDDEYWGTGPETR